MWKQAPHLICFHLFAENMSRYALLAKQPD